MARTDWSTIRSTDFPSIDQFRWTARLCLKKATRPKNEKEKGFFEQAVRALESPEIKILRISDFNTTGVTGPCEEGYPFHALAKSDGVSAKEDLSSGGSFGIGKNAAFALSDIQTAFISTRYKDRVGTEHVLCMGKTLFISHTSEDGKERRRKGYWGKIAGYMPLDNPSEIPSWLLRGTQGTSIFSICMRDIRSNFVERIWMTSCRNIASAVLNAMQSDPWITSVEQNFREFMKSLNKLGGGIVFEALTESEIEVFVRDCVMNARR